MRITNPNMRSFVKDIIAGSGGLRGQASGRCGVCRGVDKYHGVMSQSAQTVLAEPYRRERVLTLPYLVR